MSNKITEGKHKAGCQCGFCKNKGNIGKWKKGGDKPEGDKPEGDEAEDSKKPTAESIVSTLLDS